MSAQSQVPVIAIDGPSGSGKGTIARNVASRLGWHLLDSGALYRLVALAATRDGLPLDDAEKLAEVARNLEVQFDSDNSGGEQIWLSGSIVTDEVRTEECGKGASTVAPLQPVRTALLTLQRGFRRMPGLVADGRDMGTHVFPDAGLKVYLTASAGERLQLIEQRLMTRENLVTVPVGTTLEEAKKLLHQHRIEKLPVVDQEGRLKGLITVKDIQKAIRYPNACKDELGRLRVGAAVGVTSAWTSTSSGLVPSIVGTMAEPVADSWRCAKKASDGLETSASPAFPISKMPTSLVGPKRFLTLRRIR